MKKIILLRVVFVAVLICIFAMLLSGCSITEKFQAWKNGVISEEQDDKVAENGEPNVINPDEPQVIVPDKPEGNKVVGTDEQKEVSLYFVNSKTGGLEEEKRYISKVSGIARATIGELIKGPDLASGLEPSIPHGTKLLDINIKEDGSCIADFSGELTKNFSGGSGAESLLVNSIVATLGQFSSVTEVQILVDGRAVDSIGGHVDISEAIAVQ